MSATASGDPSEGHALLADKPIFALRDDRLHRLDFVRGIARRLVQDNRATGIAVGLVGPWGCGKSSILNLLEAELDGDGKDLKRPLVVRFEPWLVSGRDDLIAHFFVELVKGLRKRLGRYRVYDSGRDQAADQAVKIIQTYGDAISPLFRLVLPGADVVGKLATAMVNTQEKARTSLHAQRDDVRKALGSFDFPIVVMIDELDRVDDAEVRMMAQLIRSIADFSAISYVVAYDEDRVAEALGSGLQAAERGRAYLEKIIQLRLPVPFTRPAELKTLLGDDLKATARLAGIVLTSSQERRLRRLVNIVVPGGVTTTRDIAKITADVSARLITIDQEVDFVDCVGFVILEMRSRRISLRVRNSMTRPEERIALREYFHAEILRKHGHTALPYELQVHIPEKNEPLWDDQLFEFLWPHASTTPEWSEVTPQRIMFRRPLLTLVKHAVPAGVARTQEIVDAISTLDHSEIPAFWTEDELSSFEGLLSRIEELPEHLTTGRVRRLLDLAAARCDAQMRSHETYLTSEMALRIAGSLNRISAVRESRERVNLPGWVVNEVRSGRFVLACALLAPDRALTALNSTTFRFSPSPMSEKKRGELRALLLHEMTAHPQYPWRISLPMILNLASSDIESSEQREFRFSGGDPSLIMDPQVLGDFLALWFERVDLPFGDVRPELVERDQLLASLRKNPRVGFGRHGEPLQRLKDAREFTGFFTSTAAPKRTKRK